MGKRRGGRRGRPAPEGWLRDEEAEAARDGEKAGDLISSEDHEEKDQENPAPRAEEKDQGKPAPHEGDVLAELRFEGPVWRLCDEGEEGRGHCVRGCEKMLEQALGCSELADVRFVFNNGSLEHLLAPPDPLGGHKGWLSGVSEIFAAMFRSGMRECETGRVPIQGVSRESFTVFLSFLYVGRCGSLVKMADGRELWVLAKAYQVAGLNEWLVEEGVWDMDSACAAAQFAKSAEGSFDELLEVCTDFASWALGRATEEGLRGVGVETAAALLAAHCENEQQWRACDVLERFKFAERWVRANGGGEEVRATGVERLVDTLELSRLPLDVISRVVRPSGLVTEGRLFDLAMDIHNRQQRGLMPWGLSFEQVSFLDASTQSRVPCKSITSVAIGASDEGQIVAALDKKAECIHIFRVGGEYMQSIGPEVEGLGALCTAGSIVFTRRGELLVSIPARKCIEVFSIEAFTCDFQHSHTITLGVNCKALAVSPQDHIVGSSGCSIKVWADDGTLLRTFGEEGSLPGQLSGPAGLIAVGPDGSIVVVDQDNFRVQIFDCEGLFVRMFGKQGDGAGEFRKPYGVCTLSGGHILVSDWKRQDIQVFSWEGVYLRSICQGGNSNIELESPHGLAVDAEDRVFVARHSTPNGVYVLSRVRTLP